MIDYSGWKRGGGPSEVLIAMAAKQLTLDEALAAGAASVEGELAAARALCEAFDITMLGAALREDGAADRAAAGPPAAERAAAS